MGWRRSKYGMETQYVWDGDTISMGERRSKYGMRTQYVWDGDAVSMGWRRSTCKYGMETQ